MSVINPNTGKKIKIGGPTYKKLEKEGYFKVEDKVFHGHAQPQPENIIPSPHKEQNQSPHNFHKQPHQKNNQEWIINPKTGRKVKVSSKTYHQIKKEIAANKKSPHTNNKAKSPHKNKKKSPYNKPKVKSGFTVVQLKELLKKENLSTKGLKGDLEKRYNDFLASKKEPRKGNEGNNEHEGHNDDLDINACAMPEYIGVGKQNFSRRTLSPTKKQTVETKIDIDAPTQCEKCECCICMDEFTGEDIVRFNCIHTVCKSCKYQMPKKECPICRKDVSSFFMSPTSNRRQQENYKSFKKFIDMEKTADDARIAAELQSKLNSEMNFNFKIKKTVVKPPCVVPEKKKVMRRKRNM